MIKKKLQKIRVLSATDKMLQMASEDEAAIKQEYYWHAPKKKYQYGLYMRCRVMDGILKAAFFLTEPMKMGARLPAYELFIDKEAGKFLTYDRIKDKWLTAKLDMLTWPDYVRDSEKKWISAKDDQTVRQYLGMEHGGYRGLLDYQLKVRADELQRRHKRETDPWDLDLEQTPELPRDWDKWVSKVGIPENFIFYRYSRKGADRGYCTYCEREVPIFKPRHNKTGTCLRCRHRITFKSEGKTGWYLRTGMAYMYLLQRCTDGFMVRTFQGERTYKKGSFQEASVYCCEIRRTVCSKHGEPLRAYYWGEYKQKEMRWIKGQIIAPSKYWYRNYKGRVYGRTLPDLMRHELCRTGLGETARNLGRIDPENYLVILSRVPELELLAKGNLPFLLKEYLDSSYKLKEQVEGSKGSSLKHMLGIDSSRISRLRKNKGGIRFLKWLQYEKQAGELIPDNIIAWFCREKIMAEDLKFISDRMSLIQIYNYICRQMSETGMSSGEVLTTWKDYLSMAVRFHMDVGDAIVYRVRKLRQRHDELVEQCHRKDLGIRAGEILKKYPHVESVYEALGDKYAYADKNYTILVPKSIEEIMLEGEALHHCVGSSERYYDRINRQESYILFLRKSQDVERPYYTLEVEPDGTVRQKRTMFDRQEPDIEDATRFLRKWQKELAKRLSREDRMLAGKSRILRKQEYEELRENQVVINTGHLQGRLLVDVLTADLLENEELNAALPMAEAA